MKDRGWQRLKRRLLGAGIAFRLRPFGIAFSSTLFRSRITRWREAIYGSRQRILSANVISGAMIALSVYSIGQSGFLDYLALWGARWLLVLRELIAMRRAMPISPVMLVAVYALVIGISAGICSYFRSFLKILGLNLLLVLAIVVLAGTSWARAVPLSAAVVVLLIMGGAAFDYYFEERFHKQRLKNVAEKQQSEHAILRHLSHSLNPTVQTALSPLRGISAYMEEQGLLDRVMAKRRDGSGETVGDALETAVVSLQQIREIIETTESIFGNEVTADRFQEVNLAVLFEHEIIPLFKGKPFHLQFRCARATSLRLHRPSIVQAVKNLVRNAEVHGFSGGYNPQEAPYVRFEIRETVKEVIVDCCNNGAPFPSGLSTRDFLAFGRKGKQSPGKGLGGAWVKKCVEIHGGTFRKVSNSPVRFRITLPKRRTLWSRLATSSRC